MFSLKKLSPTITDMIRFDHSHVMVTFHQYSLDKPASVRKALAETICRAVEVHATLEEEIFYPAMREISPDQEVMRKAVPEHNEIRETIAQLRRTDAEDPAHDRLMMQLMRHIIHHVADEETVLLPQAERVLSKEQLSDMGARMTRRRLELLTPVAGKMAKSTVIGFSRSTAAITLAAVGALFAVRRITRDAT